MCEYIISNRRLHFNSEDISLAVSLLLCSWTCSSSFYVITVSTVQLQAVQFVQYLYSKCAVLLWSWTCSSSLCLITVSTVQLQTVQFVQYLYSKCALRSYTEHDGHCVSLQATIGSEMHSMCGDLGEFGNWKLGFFLKFIWYQQSEYKIFYKLMGWLGVQFVYALVWRGTLLQGDLIHRITGQLATVVSVAVRSYLVGWGGVGGLSEFLFLYGAWRFWRGWFLAQFEYVGLRGS